MLSLVTPIGHFYSTSGLREQRGREERGREGGEEKEKGGEGDEKRGIEERKERR